MRTRAKRGRNLAQLALILLLAYFFVALLQFTGEHLFLAPSRDERSLSNYRARHPDGEIVTIQKDDRTYYVAFGARWLLNEYPAGYLFDAKGALIDWSPEADDVGRFSDYWILARHKAWSADETAPGRRSERRR
jgi:hypothetical protein